MRLEQRVPANFSLPHYLSKLGFSSRIPTHNDGSKIGHVNAVSSVMVNPRMSAQPESEGHIVISDDSCTVGDSTLFVDVMHTRIMHRSSGPREHVEVYT